MREVDAGGGPGGGGRVHVQRARALRCERDERMTGRRRGCSDWPGEGNAVEKYVDVISFYK